MHKDWTKYCYVCGPDNPKCLKLEPYIDDENVNALFASYVAPDYLCGFKGILHGGMHVPLLDCMCLWLCYLQGKPVITTEFNVKLLKPALTGEELYLRSELVSDDGKSVIVKGEIRNSKRELCTVAKITGKILSKESFTKFTGKEWIPLKKQTS